MMGKDLVYLFCCIVLGLSSCSQGHPLDFDKVNNSPVFKLDITIDGRPVNVNAGKDDFFMLTDFEEAGDFVMKKGMISRYSPTSGASKPTFGLSTISHNILSNDLFELRNGQYKPFTTQGQTKWLFDFKPDFHGATSSFEPVFILVDGLQSILEPDAFNTVDLDDVAEISVITTYQQKLLFYTIGNVLEGKNFTHLLTERAVRFNSDESGFKFRLYEDYKWTDVVIELPDGQTLKFDNTTKFNEPGEYVFTLFDSISGAYISSNVIVNKFEIGFIENSVFMNTTFQLQDKEAYEKYFVFEYVDENGLKYSSVDFAEGHYFNVVDISSFEDSPQNTPTQKITVEFDIPLADSAKQEIISMKGVGVFALPENF